MNTIKKPELLAPAGSFEKLKIAFAYGADAVYAGLPMFSLRTTENTFDLEEVRKGIEYAHRHGRRFYLTANIYAHNPIIPQFIEAMDRVIPFGADAYIMSDPGLMDIIRQRYPDLPIHLSTQANNTNWAQVRFWQKQGVSRVILARELTLVEIQEIVQKNPTMELECFVHGAMCMSYSGRCLLSDYLSGDPSNAGRCKQSCRWEYAPHKSIQEKPEDYVPPEEGYYVTEAKRPDEKFPVEEDRFGTYIFYSKDLCAVELMPQILATGVHSVKIEGRNKTVLYLATTVQVYRQAIDAVVEGRFEEQATQWANRLTSISWRGYTQGFFLGDLHNTINYKDNFHPTHVFGGVPVSQQPDGYVEITVKNKLSVGDELEWITPAGSFYETLQSIHDQHDQEIETVSPGVTWNPKIFSRHLIPENALLQVASKREKWR